MASLQVLTAKQIAALGALSASRFQTASELKVAGSALDKLMVAGLVDARWPEDGLKPATYRINRKGQAALGRARRIARSR